MKNILLLGGAGFLGINLSISLLKSGFEVHILDRSCAHLREVKDLQSASGFHEVDISNVDDVINIVDRFSIECVINLASALIPSSEFESFSRELTLSALPMFNIINQLAARRIKYVLFSSGGTVYGKGSLSSRKESNPRKPINLYGFSKLILEEYVEYMSRIHMLEYLIIRPSNPYGPYQNPNKKQGLIAVAIDKVINGDCIEIWGDGSAVRDYIYVEDFANAIAGVIKNDIWCNAFNIGSGVGYTISQVLDIISTVAEKKVSVKYTNARSVDLDKIVLDISKLKKAIDFKPTPLDTGIYKYYMRCIGGNA